jgi:hypothetical protein
MKKLTVSSVVKNCLLICLGLMSLSVQGAKFKPFISAAAVTGSIEEASQKVAGKLKAGGFEIVGVYSPYSDNSARIIGVTNEELKKNGSTHNKAGFSAVMRVSVTANNGVMEVSYTNPPYHGMAYHVGPLAKVAKQLSAALGGGEAFGAKGLSKGDLSDYHYQMFMPYFEDAITIASFSSHEKAVKAARKSLSHAKSDMTQVWEVKVNDRQTVIGAQLNRGWWKGQIQKVMSKVDTGTPRSTAALPWEVLVTGKDMVYLPGRFRIALMFPDLTMSSFMNIMEVPGQMEASANKLAELSK